MTNAILPIIDISPLTSDILADRLAVAQALDAACAETGFAYIKGSQHDPALFDGLLAQAKAYFAQSLDAKMADYIGQSLNHSGYCPVGEERLDMGTDELKEAYDVNYDYLPEEGRRPLLGPNIWPDLPGFREDVQAYYAHIMAIGQQLFRAFALALGLDEGYFTSRTVTPPNQLRLLYYPYDPGAHDRPGAGAHTDYECFTLLFATAPGLQIVDKTGQWADVPLVGGTLIMNIGDMMEIMSNGRYVATRHRVKRVGQTRYSFPTFNAMSYDHVVEPVVPGQAPRYAPQNSGQHLFNRTAETFAYLKQRIAAGELVLHGVAPPDAFGQKVAEPAE